MYRTRFAKDIVCEFLPPTRITKRNKVIIYSPGLPSSPTKRVFAEFYSKKGFWVFLPRYRGTWESGGQLLQNEPTKDIKDVIDGVCNGFVDIPSSGLGKPTRYSLQPAKLILVGSSFGGPAVLLNSKDLRVSKVICLSPVVDWSIPSRVERAKWFWPFVKEAFGEAFRINQEGIKKLYKTPFYNPNLQKEKIEGSKVLIIHAKDDEIVTFPPVEAFSKSIDAKLIVLKKGGHLSSHYLTKSKSILNFLNLNI